MAVFDTTKNTIQFRGWDFPVHSIGSGLDATCVVISIEISHQLLDLWELYTDTPSGVVNATPKEIRKKAKDKIAETIQVDKIKI